jgi:uncharacterized protein YndB with AHSA1/START domain
MSATKNDDVGLLQRSIVTTRIFDAPRELVFEAFTNPKHLPHWWGPNGFTLTTRSMEIKPGGVWRFVMHGPDGTDYQNRIVYDEIVPPERITFHHDAGEEEIETSCFETTVTFEDLGGKTKLVFHAVFPTVADRERAAGYAIEGAKQTLGRLAEHLKTMS